jgi:glycosyltransferase involved in cell wall biosynthesis
LNLISLNILPMTQDKVSVIIPAFNRARYIRQTIESVLNQTYTNIELIVVDDGSTDDTRDQMDIYSARIILLEHPGQQNRGQSASINLGMEYASGAYIGILDSDDYWEPDKIELQVQYLIKNPDIGLVYCNGTAVSSSGKYLYDIYPPSHEEENKPEKILLNCNIHLPTNSLMRMAVLKKAGRFDESLRAAQDHDMLIRVSEICRFGYINKSLYHYRRHEESISKSSKGAARRWQNGFSILAKAKTRYPYPASVIRKRKAVLYFRLFQSALESGSRLKALPLLALACLHDPARALLVLIRKERIRSHH